MDYTVDDFLGGKVRLKQPQTGYRATSDSVTVAAAVPVKPNDTVLDVGCASGIIGLCLNAREPNVHITGVELQPELVLLAHENATLNQCDMDIVQADIAQPLPQLKGVLFNHVVTNPPFYTEHPRRQSNQVAMAYQQQVSLSVWLDFCLKHLHSKGTFTMIHRPEAVPEILSFLRGRLGGLLLVPLYSKAGRPPKRILIQGVMGSRKPFMLHGGIVLHNTDDTRTQIAEDIMRLGAKIELLK